MQAANVTDGGIIIGTPRGILYKQYYGTTTMHPSSRSLRPRRCFREYASCSSSTAAR
jgi:hypothetical protein